MYVTQILLSESRKSQGPTKIANFSKVKKNSKYISCMIRLQASPQCQHEMKMFSHDDVIKWKQFPRYWPFVRGIHRSPTNSPHKGQWRGALMSSLICAWTNGSVNHRDPGDLRRLRAHYDVTVTSLYNYPIVKGIQSVSVDSPHKWPLMMIFCFCVILNKLHGIWYMRTQLRIQLWFCVRNLLLKCIGKGNFG